MNALLNDNQRLLTFYFNLLKVSYVISAGMILSLMQDGFHWFLLGAVVTGFTMLGLQFFLAVKTKEWMEDKKYFGLIVALILNSILLSSMFFPLGIAGYFILLRPQTQMIFPRETNPDWLNEFFDYLNKMTKDLKKA